MSGSGALNIMTLCSAAGIAAIVAIAACADYSNTVDPARGLPDVVVATPSFAADIVPIYEKRCSIGGCHSLASAQADLVLTRERAYDETVNRDARLSPGRKRVKPFDADASFLVRVLSDDPARREGVSRMPLASTPLTPNQITTIVNWVNQGARRN